jgi:hypothetical protein
MVVLEFIFVIHSVNLVSFPPKFHLVRYRDLHVSILVEACRTYRTWFHIPEGDHVNTIHLIFSNKDAAHKTQFDDLKVKLRGKCVAVESEMSGASGRSRNFINELL